MKKNSFFAMLYRMNYISRWGLMRNTISENLSEHSLHTSVIAHALALIGRKLYHKQLSPERAALLALYHDAGEIITGDMPTPVKYYNEQISSTYKQIEKQAVRRLLDMLPDELKDEFDQILDPSGSDLEYLPILKAADKLSALIKCIEEQKTGNHEFDQALETQKNYLAQMNLPEVQYFMEHFVDAFYLSLDELN